MISSEEGFEKLLTWKNSSTVLRFTLNASTDISRMGAPHSGQLPTTFPCTVSVFSIAEEKLGLILESGPHDFCVFDLRHALWTADTKSLKITLETGDCLLLSEVKPA